MFFRIKPSGERRYLQIVENTRDGARTVDVRCAAACTVDALKAPGKPALPASQSAIALFR